MPRFSYRTSMTSTLSRASRRSPTFSSSSLCSFRFPCMRSIRSRRLPYSLFRDGRDRLSRLSRSNTRDGSSPSALFSPGLFWRGGGSMLSVRSGQVPLRRVTLTLWLPAFRVADSARVAAGGDSLSLGSSRRGGRGQSTLLCLCTSLLKVRAT